MKAMKFVHNYFNVLFHFSFFKSIYSFSLVFFFLSYSIFCSLLFAFTFLFSFPFSFYRSIYPLLSLLPIIINSLNSLSSHPSGNSEDFSLGETPLRSLILLYLWSYFYSIFSVEGIFIEQTPLSATSCLSSPKALRICG